MLQEVARCWVINLNSRGCRSILNQFSYNKVVEATELKEEKRGKPKPEEQEGMPQHQHCPLSKHHGDRSPEYHEEQQKDVA
jgi:hypothetical protein